MRHAYWHMSQVVPKGPPGSFCRVCFARLLKGGGMAARYHSGYLVSRRRGALSHAKALATGERLHLESVHIPKLIQSLSIGLA
jgi:hypothetical protein